MLLSLHEPDINPSSNYIQVQNPLTDSFFSLHRRHLSQFPKGFSLICWIPFASWRLLFWQVQNTHQFGPSLYRQHFVEFATPPEKTPQQESGEMCHIPHDAHSYDNEDPQCRFFFLHQRCAEVVWGCVTCQHLHPVEASWQRSLLMLMLTLPLEPLFSMLQALSVHLLSCLIVKLLKRRILHGQRQHIEFATCFPLNHWVTNLKHPKALAQHSAAAPQCASQSLQIWSVFRASILHKSVLVTNYKDRWL